MKTDKKVTIACFSLAMLVTSLLWGRYFMSGFWLVVSAVAWFQVWRTLRSMK
jgi:hypothetical protein